MWYLLCSCVCKLGEEHGLIKCCYSCPRGCTPLSQVHPMWAQLHFFETRLYPRYPRTASTPGRYCPSKEELSYESTKRLNTRGPVNKWRNINSIQLFKKHSSKEYWCGKMPTIKLFFKEWKETLTETFYLLTETFYLWMITLRVIFFFMFFPCFLQ